MTPLLPGTVWGRDDLMHARTRCGGSPLPSQHASLQLGKAPGAAQENAAALAVPGKGQTGPGQQQRDQGHARGHVFATLPLALPHFAPVAANPKFIGIITYEKSVPSEDGRGWGWVADCNLMIRLKYAKANK